MLPCLRRATCCCQREQTMLRAYGGLALRNNPSRSADIKAKCCTPVSRPMVSLQPLPVRMETSGFGRHSRGKSCTHSTPMKEMQIELIYIKIEFIWILTG